MSDANAWKIREVRRTSAVVLADPRPTERVWYLLAMYVVSGRGDSEDETMPIIVRSFSVRTCARSPHMDENSAISPRSTL